MSFNTRERGKHLRRATALGAMAVSALLAVAGCTGESSTTGSTTTTGSEDRDPYAPETTDITGASFRAGGSAALIEAELGGYASEYGITITPEWIESSAIALSSLISGDVQVAYSSYAGVIDAVQQGIPLVLVAEAIASTPGAAMLEALPDSGITSIEDLPGKTVAVVSLNSSHAVKIKDSLIDAGIDPATVNFVELPYGEVPAALEQGTVDASSATGASLRQAKDELSTVTVFDYGGGKYEGMAEAGWIMTQDFVSQNPNTVAAFQCSMQKGADKVMTDDATYRDILVDPIGLSQEAAALDVRNTFQSEIRPDPLQLNADILENIEVLTSPFDMQSIVEPWPDNC